MRKLDKLILKMEKLYKQLSEKKNTIGLDGWDSRDYFILTTILAAKDELLKDGWGKK